jgi:hypothetical protein
MVLARQGLIFNVTLRNPQIHVRQTDQGWNVARLTRQSDTTGDGPDVRIPHLDLINATIELDPLDAETRRLTSVNAETSLEVIDGRTKIGLDELTGVDPATNLRIEHLAAAIVVENGGVTVSGLDFRTPESRVAGSVTLPPDENGRPPVSFSVEANPIVLAEVRRYTSVLPDFPDDLRLTFDAQGTIEDFSGRFQAQSSEG